MKDMCQIIPAGSCPKCGHKQFIVVESTSNIFLTGIDGEILDAKEMFHEASGICQNCYNEFSMISTSMGFIPATPLRKLLYDTTIHYTPYEEYDKLPENPMEAKK